MENWTDQQIERYLSGAMVAPERQAFEDDLGQDADLQQALKKHEMAREALDVLLRENIADIYLRVRKKPSWISRLLLWPAAPLSAWWRRARIRPTGSSVAPKFVYAFRSLAMAAAVLLPAIFGLHWYTNQYCTDAALFTEIYVPEQVVSTLGDEQPAFLNGFEAYRKGNFPAAIAYFKAVSPSDQQYLDASFYLGHSYLASGGYTAAILAFDRVAKDPHSPFAQNAEWNRLLAMLGAGRSNDPEFKAALDKIANAPRHNYQASALDLRKKLGSILRRAFL